MTPVARRGSRLTTGRFGRTIQPVAARAFWDLWIRELAAIRRRARSCFQSPRVHRPTRSRWIVQADSGSERPRRSWIYMLIPAIRQPFAWNRTVAVGSRLKRGTLQVMKRTSLYVMLRAALACPFAFGPAHLRA